MKSSLNHRKLCEIGARFLKRCESSNGHGCHFAIIEAACYGENPDVFGIRHGINNHGMGTFLLEAKMSRSDFLADRAKPHRINPETGVGKYRYYICPTGLIKPEELPNKWGLIYVSEGGICKVVAGVLSAPKIKYFCEWSKKNKSHLDHGQVQENFKTFAFEQRNYQNELNLLTMALARLQDPEELLYMQRQNMRLKTQLEQKEQQIRSLERELNMAEFQSKRIRSELDQVVLQNS